MKKLFLLIAMCLWALVPQAQKKCAVLTFQSGEGVTLNEAEAVTVSFRSYFRPSNYEVLAGNPVDNAAKDLGLYNNRNSLTHQQIMRMANKLGADYVIVGALDKFRSGYHVDISIVQVTGGISFTKYSNGNGFTKEDNKKAMEDMAKLIAANLPKTSGSSSSNNNNNNNSNNNNSSTQNTSGSNIPNGYVDLGLPSGTLWAKENFSRGFISSDDLSQYLNMIPSTEQWKELLYKCKWTKNGNNYTVKGPNGNTITLPIAGYNSCFGKVIDKGETCFYWTNKFERNGDKAYIFMYNSKDKGCQLMKKCNNVCLRLVRKK